MVKKLCEKQPLALRACKEAYRDSLLIPDMEAALAYSAAKSDQLSLLQNNAWKDQGIKQFLEGSYASGKSPYKKDS